MTTTTPAPPDDQPSEPDRDRATAPSRRALPIWAVLVATVVALVAAVGVYVALDDDGDTGLTAEGALDLTPVEAAGDADVLDLGFVLPEGGEGTLRPLVDRPTVVNFFASWCAPCVTEMPDFERASAAFDGEVTFVGLAVNDRTADATRIVDQTGISYFWARDARGDIATAAGSISMPTTMFLGADGTIVDVHSGAVDYDRLLDLIEEHLDATPEAGS